MARQLNMTRGSFDVDLIHAVDLSPATDAAGMHLGLSPSLFGPPAVVFDEQTLVTTPGSIITPKTHRARDMVVSVVLMSADTDDLESMGEALAAGLDAVADSDPVRLTYTRGDASERWIDAFPISMVFGPVQHAASPTQTVRVGFRAAWPYWSDGADRTETETTFAGKGTGWSAAIDWDAVAEPWSGVEYAQGSITATGDVAVQPVWEIDGPATSVELFHEGTGESFQWAGTLLTGGKLTIDTRAGQRSVAKGDGNAWSGVSPSSTMFDFAPGAHNWGVSLKGSAAASEVRLLWAPAWLTC